MASLLPLEKQDRYRARYGSLTPGYKHSGSIYEGLVAKHASPRARVLDAGCGRGGVIELYAEKVGQAVGLDSDLVSLKEHRCLKDRVVGDLARTPFSSGSFDLVLSAWVVEHLERPEPVFAELARVLKKGGHLIILTPNAWNYIVLMNRLLPAPFRRFLVDRICGRQREEIFPVFYRANSRGRLQRGLSCVGLQEEEFHYVGDPSYIAFNDWLFKLGVLLERLVDLFSLRSLKVHLVASYVKA